MGRYNTRERLFARPMLSGCHPVRIAPYRERTSRGPASEKLRDLMKEICGAKKDTGSIKGTMLRDLVSLRVRIPSPPVSRLMQPSKERPLTDSSRSTKHSQSSPLLYGKFLYLGCTYDVKLF